jgi:hypothetical protein|tara:strand:+ start:7314 stop:7619 length:306 start_codon:yes stop_codon:yes gene_type:complete
MKNVLFRDISDKHSPKIVAEMQQDDADILPKVGEKMSFHIKKKSNVEVFGSYSNMIVPRSYDVVEVKHWISGIDEKSLEYSNVQLRSVEISLVHDGSEAMN